MAAPDDQADPAEPGTGGRVRSVPGEVARPGSGRRLDRPPSDRYPEPQSDGSATGGSIAWAMVGGLVPAAIGGGLLVALGSPLAMSGPLVAVALVTGLATGFGVRLGGRARVSSRRRRKVAVAIALVAIVGAEVVVWQLALAEGGVLAFPDYELQVFGPVAVLQPIAGGLAAWASA